MLNILDRIYRNTLLPRVAFIPFWITSVVMVLVDVYALLFRRRQNLSPTTLCIEAGALGWESIEFKELYASACEYLGDRRVIQLVVDRKKDYLTQVERALDQHNPTHYFYDARTGSQNWAWGLWQSFRIALMLRLRSITPIVLLTDLAVRTWRVQSAVVSARSGVVIIFMSPRKIYPIFPHNRFVGPSLMPLSAKTLDFLDSLAQSRPVELCTKALFIGSLYEPRITILNEIHDKLASKGFAFEIRGRQVGGTRISDSEYWKQISHAPLIVTTADQMVRDDTDWTWIPNLIYRYIEVTACGTMLIAPAVPAVERFFVPGEHFVSFTLPANAVEVIEYYMSHDAEREKIAAQGREKARSLVNARIFWVNIDVALGKNALT